MRRNLKMLTDEILAATLYVTLYDDYYRVILYLNKSI